MIRIHAAAIVASVPDEIGEVSVRKKERYPVGSHHLALKPERTIASTPNSALPLNAARGHLTCLAPESVHTHIITVKQMAAYRQLGRINVSAAYI